jgi:PiT family inorganic phosphate transporter
MSDITASGGELSHPIHQDMHKRPHYAGLIAFIIVLLLGLGYTASQLLGDLSGAGGVPLATGAFVLLGLALLIALGFEFVNGFHDTANAVATVIYTNSMPPLVAVIWSGAFNFLGVLVSSGAVAYSMVTLLPVELILQAGSTAGYDMIFALLIAAIIWNLGTWALGLPNSSSHALVGSIMGVGIANQLLAPQGDATSGVDWSQAIGVLRALLFSPVLGFVLAAVLLLVMKLTIKNRALYAAPAGKAPPPIWIRGLLILTCTGVSYAHGGNDGQKGMGLIMLILIGAAPTAFALNRAVPESTTPAFVQTTEQARAVFNAHVGSVPAMDPDQARDRIGLALRERDINKPEVFAALAAVSGDIAKQVQNYGSLKMVPAAATSNMRNDMYLTGDAVRVLGSPSNFTNQDMATLKSYRASLEGATRFIPPWVKVAVAVALGLGTMVGWKRIVITVGEKIGKTHLTYAQGASAEIVAAVTIEAAEVYGLPVSTTHILSSGVAGTMAANGSGLQWGTIRNMALAWIMTLPAAMLISGSLYALLRQLF